jgi:hypothetical protein
MEKVAWLKKAYGTSGLPCLPGMLYPRHFYPPDGIKELPMLMMDKRHMSDWDRARDIICRRNKLNKAELTLEVRPSPIVKGLLLYRICATLEKDDDNELTDAKVIQTARELVNAFVTSAAAGQLEEIAWEVPAVARTMEPAQLELGGRLVNEFTRWKPTPVFFPMVDIELISGPPILRQELRATRDGVNTRHIGLPGDPLMLCCDEAFYQAMIAQVPSLQLAHYLRQTPERWTEYARDRSGVGVRNAVQEATEVYDAASAVSAAASKPLATWADKNPGEAVLIALGVIVVSALAFWALPALAAELAALAAASLAASSSAISGAFIESAAMSAAVMQQATALELAAAAQLNIDAAILASADAASLAAIQTEAATIASATAIPAGAAAGGVLVAAEAALLRQTVTVIGRRLVVEAQKNAPKAVGAGVGITLERDQV